MNLQENIQRILHEETKHKIKSYEFDDYTLILSKNPCDVFKFFDVKKMHGLNLKDCEEYDNTKSDAYISGLTNLSPKDKKPFLFLNTSRLGKESTKFGLIMHEMMHLSFILHNYNIKKEEDIITWAEDESYKIYKLIK